MVIPGYDPEDVDEMLEQYIGEEELGDYLSETELQSYRTGDETLVDMLSGEEIQELLQKADAPVDVPE